MAVYVDRLINIIPTAAWPYHQSCHMLADTLQELHEMAHRLRLKPEWFQDKRIPHYDLTNKKRIMAINRGVLEITPEQLHSRYLAAQKKGQQIEMKIRHWTEQPLIGFDTESTGIDPKTSRIIQAAIVTLDPAGILDNNNEPNNVIWIDPGEPIPEEASKIHGITAEVLKTNNAFPSAKGLDYICHILQSRALQRKYPLVIYNVCYDFPLLMNECRRAEIIFNPKFFFLDPLIIDRALDKYRPGSRRLEDVAKHYSVKLEQAHGALADTKAALGVMMALIKKYPELQKYSLEEMQVKQGAWYIDWRDHINQFWKAKGINQQINGFWPLGEGNISGSADSK